jgi:electron transfer flavoprotein beta subunit
VELPEGGLWCPLSSHIGGEFLKILVFIKEAQDIKIPLAYNEPTRKLKTDWNVPILNPADSSAIELALRIKDNLPETHITLIHLGPTSGERWIREGLALGCDEGVRIWEEGLDEIGTRGKALIFARVAKILNFDLILTGIKSQDTGNGQIGILLASYLKAPCISSVITFEIKEMTVIATKGLAHGYREYIASPIPLVVGVEAHEELNRYASLPAFLEANEKEIPCFDLPQIGIPRELVQQKDASLIFGPLQFPRSRLKFIPPPDSSLPAFERIKKLIEGVVASREGKLVRGEEDGVVEGLFQTLLQEGWLNHLRKNS